MPIDMDSLNPAQREAVLSTEGPLLVLAGAGSGKTRVLTLRIANILASNRASAHEVLAITFTNKAAAEMRERIGDLVGGSVRAMWVLTFHAMCVRMLRADADRLGYTRYFSIYDDDDSYRLVRDIVSDLDLDPKVTPINGIRGRISWAKNKLIGPGGFEASASRSPIDQAAVRVYHELQKRLLRANAMDFDDLLVNGYRLLSEHEVVLESYQRRFRYILVDEYQDTNLAQYEIVNLLAASHRNLMVVGDDDQSIYSWRGADIQNILDFEKDYPEAKVVKLLENYRSTGNILRAANAVVSNNANRRDKELFTSSGDGEKIGVYLASDERDEARWIALRIERERRVGRSHSDMAIFYRTNAQSRSIEDMLLRSGVPYRIVGGTRFFDRAEIRDVMSYLKFIVNPADDMALRRVVNTPRRGIGDATMERLAYTAATEGITLADALELAIADEDYATRVRTKLGEFNTLITSMRDLEGSLRDLVEAIIEKSGLIDALKREGTHEAEGRIENIGEFFSVAQEFAESHEDAGLPAFLEWLALRTDLDTLGEGESAVTLMTVHSAKGLEFPIVFVAGMEDSIFPHMNAMMDPEGLEEERRLAYVAITRAREQLFLTLASTRSLYGNVQANPRSRFIGEIPDEILEHSGTGSSGYSGFGHAKRGDRGSSFGSGRSDGGVTFGAGIRDGRSPAPAAQRGIASDVEFAVGDAVDHKVFGRGTVLAIDGDALRVRFSPTVGEKKLLKGYAPIVKIRS